MKPFKLHYNELSEQPYHVTLNARNGKVLYTTENFKSKQSAIENILDVVSLASSIAEESDVNDYIEEVDDSENLNVILP